MESWCCVWNIPPPDWLLRQKKTQYFLFRVASFKPNSIRLWFSLFCWKDLNNKHCELSRLYIWLAPRQRSPSLPPTNHKQIHISNPSKLSNKNWTPVVPDISRMLLMPCLSHLSAEDQLPPGFPTIDMGPQLKVVERTRTATMLCAASGNPDPDISWFKDFLPVNTTNNNGRIKQLRSGRPPLVWL